MQCSLVVVQCKHKSIPSNLIKEQDAYQLLRYSNANHHRKGSNVKFYRFPTNAHRRDWFVPCIVKTGALRNIQGYAVNILYQVIYLYIIHWHAHFNFIQKSHPCLLTIQVTSPQCLCFQI